MKTVERHDTSKPRRVSRLNGWGPVVLWAGVLFALSSIPGQDIPTVHFSMSDKIVHCGIYGIFGILSFRALRLTTRLTVWSAILVVVLMALGYGISDEVHQMFVPQRSSDQLDVLADVIGGTLGAVVASRWSWGRARPRGGVVG